jgi:acyl-CoA thioesterase-1
MALESMESIRGLLTGASPIRWVFAGDSITHGAAHTVGWRDYTELFSERVRWELGRSRDIVIKTGISGWTVRDLLADLDWNVLQFQPDCVSLMFGLNDCLGGEAGIDDFRADYLEIIAQIRARTGAAILLHTPNWMLPTDRAARLDNLPAYRAAILDIAQETGTPCIDHFPIWVAAEPSGGMHHWLAHGCHPNEYGHRVLAHTMFRALGIWDERGWTCQLNVPSYVS